MIAEMVKLVQEKKDDEDDSLPVLYLESQELGTENLSRELGLRRGNHESSGTITLQLYRYSVECG